MNVTTYVRQLPLRIQADIKDNLYQSLEEEGYTGSELAEHVDNGMSSRLSDLKDTIDIEKYVERGESQ